ncbi:MAG: hypothetical protein D6765_05320 [Bacteroidetes bacterium]|nr:MAG: hypothetical protein D6765_05320 [Bacteroidota bacterium]
MIPNASAMTAPLQEGTPDEKILAAGLEERRRIAQELHDGLGCTLALAQLLSDALPNRDCTRARELRNLLRQAQWDLRALLNNLVPEYLLQQGLSASIRQLVERCSRFADIQLELTLDDPCGRAGNLPAELQIHIFRLVQELLHNVIQHASNPTCTLHLQFENTHLVLCYQDQGKPLPAGATPFFLQERVRRLGGELRCHQLQDSKQFTIRLPLQTAEKINPPLSKNRSRENCRP